VTEYSYLRDHYGSGAYTQASRHATSAKVAYGAALSAALARRRRSSCVLRYHGVAPVEAEIFQEHMQVLARNLSVDSLDHVAGTRTRCSGTGAWCSRSSIRICFRGFRAAPLAWRMHWPQASRHDGERRQLRFGVMRARTTEGGGPTDAATHTIIPDSFEGPRGTRGASFRRLCAKNSPLRVHRLSQSGPVGTPRSVTVTEMR
jgi:hypothetical protein